MLTAGTPRSTTARRRHLLRNAGVVGVVACVMLGSVHVVLARFSTTRSSATSTVAAGTVTLGTNVSGACGVTNMLPGASPTPCTLTATYSGSAPAYVAVDVLIETQAGNGGTALYNPADSAHDLQVAVSSSPPAVSYTRPTVLTTCPTGAPGGSSCYELDNELLSLTPTAAAPPNTTVTFTTTVSLPATTTTGYRGGAAQIILTVHATQSGNNSASGCTAGQSCASVRWS